MKTILLLIISNIFMTFAWYGHLKYKSSPLIAQEERKRKQRKNS